MTKNFYITSPIYYVNDVPHIGHAYTSVACDVMARFRRLQGFNVRFLTGTDEHGQKVEKSAIARGLQPQEFCDQVSEKFRELTKILQLSNDDFIRTTEERHKICAQAVWKRLEENGYIYKGVYEGWYAVRDEAFYGEDELVDGKAPSGAEVEWQKQESYFFKLSSFQDKLLMLYEAAPDFVRPTSKMNEVLAFVKSGLKDLSISRNTFSWGVRVPVGAIHELPLQQIGHKPHIMYVWLDALTNYISALGFPDENSKLYQDFWCKTTDSPVHVVGKDILRFHAIYWPAFLMAADLPLPHTIFAHGWWTNDGQKISKSVGNVIDPLKELEWLKSMGCDDNQAVDYLKYFLMREVPFGNDGDYSRANLLTRINSELANNIGNLAQRSLSMIYKNNNAEVVDISGYKGDDNPFLLIEKIYRNFDKYMQNFEYDRAIFEVIHFSTICNQFINDKAPWKLNKEGKQKEMNEVLSIIANCLAAISLLLESFLPSLMVRLKNILKIEEKGFAFKDWPQEGILKGRKINEPQIIFLKIGV